VEDRCLSGSRPEAGQSQQEMLMKEYAWSMWLDRENGKHITLVQLSDEKTLKFFIADPAVDADRVANHMDSLTDTQCEQFFDEALTVEERKERQKQRKEQRRKEQAELEAAMAAQKAEAARIRAEQKAAEKARKGKK
jgi:hypothetical protein